MAILAQTSGYAISALGFIASAAGKPLLVRAVAEACDLPAPYLSKIVNKLARAGIVRTQRGIRGGVSLAMPAQDISLLAVCEALDDPAIEQRCMLGIAECSGARACPAHEFNSRCHFEVIEFLSGKTIADIAAFETQRRWGQHNGAPVQYHTPTNGNGAQNGNSVQNGNGQSVQGTAPHVETRIEPKDPSAV